MISLPPVNSSPSCLVEVKLDNFTTYKIRVLFVIIKSMTRTLLVENIQFWYHFVLLWGNKTLKTYQIKVHSNSACLSAVLPWKNSFTNPPTEIQKFTECFLPWFIFNYIRKEKRALEAWTYLYEGGKRLIFPNSHTFFFFWTGASKLYFCLNCLYFPKLHKVELGTFVSKVYI